MDNILFQNDNWVLIDKPPGYYVHPPENQNDYPIPYSQILLYRLRDHFKKKVYPVHRLDVATSGLLLFAFNSETARKIQNTWNSEQTRKTYWAVARGYLSESGKIDLPLEADGSGLLQEALTHYRKIAQTELPFAVGKRFPTSRYSYLEIQLSTGRWHQIRRHFNRISHPLIGDGTHGDSHHNRFFREELGIAGLCLRAQKLEFPDPDTGSPLVFEAPLTEKWRKIQLLFQDFDAFKNQR